MNIIKIGGSLYYSSDLPVWLDALVKLKSDVFVVVPGGGPFADQVRAASKKWELNAQIAHDMAVLGMQQYALLMKSLNKQLELANTLEQIKQYTSQGKSVIWEPYTEVLASKDIPKDWQMTSDSLALWLAIKLSVKKMVIVKSAAVDDVPLLEIINSEIVDRYFSQYLKNYFGSLRFYAAGSADLFQSEFNSDD